MARHIMAVCVVCLLCADRVPCQQHFEDLFVANSQPQQQQQQQQREQHQLHNVQYQELNAKVYRNELATTSPSTETTDKRRILQQVQQQPFSLERSKRHASHNTHDEALPYRPQITDDFLHRIFEEYGQGDGTISINEFQRMLRQLGLDRLVERRALNSEANGSDTCIDDSRLVHHVQPHDLSHHHHHQHHHVQAGHVDCSTTSTNKVSCEHAHAHAHGDEQHVEDHAHDQHTNYTLNEQDLLNVCPILLYQLASPLEVARSGCINSAVIANVDSYETHKLNALKEDIMYVWIYAFISVFACGILGLVGVAIIPFMDSRYYKHIIQFLVSLAVGTMTGDALLHLLPHSLAGQSEKNMVLKGMTCMGGIIFFYITEHGLTMISEWRKSIAKRETKNPSRAKVMRDPESSINNSVIGDKLCKSKYSSYPYCYDEIAMDTKNAVWMHLPNAGAAGDAHDSLCNNTERKRNGKSDGKIDGEAGEMAAQSLLSTSHNNYAPIAELNHHQHHDHQQQQQQQHLPDSNTISTDLDGNSVGDVGSTLGGVCGGIPAINGNSNNTNAAVVNANNSKEKNAAQSMNDTVTVILREHESTHHGHSHKHGHVHSPPESLSAVAWMIIMGDGLHNFTDGMAIGAAFAENIAGGFSTSLAVFCHELPHELGDFAILMKAGMSVKSAVYYNLLTGVLSFIGMIFGIVFGQSEQTAQWMFAAAAGLFIYIALVDMMPELSASHKSLQQFALQILGMSSGVLIMLFIAIYESDLMNVFSTSMASSTILPTAGRHVD